MKKILLSLFLTGIGLSAMGQKETYNWAFGNYCRLTWLTTRDLNAKGVNGTPDATLSGIPNYSRTSMATIEGCFSLSDSEGNLLFYSDGFTVYNKNNQEMTGGRLTGNANSAQSGIIIPYPGSTTKYMAVSVGAFNADNLSYSTVDMTLNGGNGNVTDTGSNGVSVPFKNAKGITGETCTSIRHANGKDYWIAAPGRTGQGNTGRTSADTYFNSWLVSSEEGVSSTPVSTISPISLPAGAASGYMKFSPDGKHFIYATQTAIVVIGDFDSKTGVFSNIKSMDISVASPLTKSAYGVEFSPSMKYVYIGCSNNYIAGYSMEELFKASDPSTVVPQIINLNNGISLIAQGLQLGPDGRIYSSPQGAYYLYAIDNPDEFDALKVYRLNGLLDSPAQAGLPSFAASWFSAKPNVKPFLCTGNNFAYSIEIEMSGVASDLPKTLEWNFGDGTDTVIQQVIDGQEKYKLTHNYAAPGDYTITIVPVKSSGTRLTATTYPTYIRDCAFKSNPMIRVDFQNNEMKATFPN